MQMHKIVRAVCIDQYEGELETFDINWRWTIWEDEGTEYTSEIFYPSPEVAMAAAMLEVASTRAQVSARYDVAKAYEDR